MSKEVAERATGGAVAAAQRLKAGLRKAIQSLPEQGGNQYLRFLQDGNWVFGKANDEIEKGEDQLAVNPFSIRVGYSCWTDHPKGRKNECLAEVTAPLGQPKIEMSDLPNHSPWEWKPLIIADFKVLSGPHKGKQLTTKMTSHGGVKMLRSLMEQIDIQLDEDEVNVVPVVVLDKDHYDHDDWGRTYTPEFEIVGFISMDGEAMNAEAGEEDEKPAKKKPAAKAEPAAKPRRKVKEEPEEVDEEDEEDEDEEPEEQPAKPARRKAKKEPEPEPEEVEEEDEEDEPEEQPVRRRRRR